MRKIMPLIAILLVSGCSTMRPTQSYVSPELKAGDARTLSTDAVSYLSDVLPPARTTLVIDLPKTRGQQDSLTSAMMASLRARGYGVTVADPKTAATAGTPLRYLASPLYGGVLLRLQYQGTEASRFYPRTIGGSLVVSKDASFTVKQAGGI
ncbi:conjugal transfer protein TrbH [Klebsiella pneumoniae]